MAKAKPYGYADETIRALMTADRHRGRYDLEMQWADAVAAVLSADETIRPADIATRTGLTRNQVTGGLRIIRERGIATVNENGGVRLAKTDDDRARWLNTQADRVARDIAAMREPSKRFPDPDAVAAVRTEAERLLERIGKTAPPVAPDAVVVALPTTPEAVEAAIRTALAEPAAAKPKRKPRAMAASRGPRK